MFTGPAASVAPGRSSFKAMFGEYRALPKASRRCFFGAVSTPTCMRLVAARAGTVSRHLKIAWQVLHAITGASALLGACKMT
eukprot:4309216-Pleurochrysis_carterae.AAC.4